MKQEQAFQWNPWQFAKSVCGQTRNIPPNFSAEEAYGHFESVFSDRMVQYTEMPEWAVNYTPVTTQDTFDLTLITPGLVKKILKKCSSSSTPGPDKVPYSCLKKVPSTHKFLATLYTQNTGMPSHLVYCKPLPDSQIWGSSWSSQLSTNCPNFSFGKNLS